jgi:hypothetical protein
VKSQGAMLVALFGATLFITNPTQDDYISWLKRQVAASRSAGDQALFNFLGAPIVNASTTWENYFLFSVFTTQVDATKRVRVIGLARYFFSPLQPTPAPVSAAAPGPHLVSAGSPDHWLPEDGYVWVINPPPVGDLRVRWQPGRHSLAQPHAVATDEEERWLPEDGYVWLSDPAPPPLGDLRVRWQPGRRSSTYSHLIAAQAEGQWLPAEGYTWVANPPRQGDFRTMTKWSNPE